MSGLREVPTDELLSFQDFTPTHVPIDISVTTIPIETSHHSDDLRKLQNEPRDTDPLETNTSSPEDSKSFWTLKYYQKYFDVDTSDVVDRLLASIIPRRGNHFSNKIKTKPDLYGPFWVSLTLIFTIAISGNVTNYLQHANAQYHWKYDFHLVSYAATTITLYVSLVPLAIWGLLKWSSESVEQDEDIISSPLELICVYGYSLFIYIPVSILWSIQITWFQWLLVLIAAMLSGSVLLFTLMPALSLSRHKFFLMLGIICCHLLLAAGFKLFFFHVPDGPVATHVLVPLMANKNATV